MKARMQNFRPWFDVLAILAWGMLLLKYWLTGKLNLLIHPNYFGLTVAAGIWLLLIGGLKAWQLFKNSNRSKNASLGHISLFPPGWSSALLLTTAIIGLIVTPRVFNSQIALDRGIGESAISSRAKPQAFRSVVRPEERSLIEWVRTLHVYPEPDAYTGKKVKIDGFVVYPPELPAEYVLISRFVITCCAADAYPVGLPVKLDQDRTAFSPDTWLEVEGQMIAETIAGKRQLIVQAKSLKKIPTPENPYYY
jgi:uncharacterized repeat protein (TIGR03943 family)